MNEPHRQSDPFTKDGSDAQARRSEADSIMDQADAVAEALRQLCRMTIARPPLPGPDVDVTLGHLATAAAALPQACSQLSDMLAALKDDPTIELDEWADSDDVELLLDVARLRLDAARELSVELHRQLNGARNEAAHLRHRAP